MRDRIECGVQQLIGDGRAPVVTCSETIRTQSE
jgi:hypothetical protein